MSLVTDIDAIFPAESFYRLLNCSTLDSFHLSCNIKAYIININLGNHNCPINCRFCNTMRNISLFNIFLLFHLGEVYIVISDISYTHKIVYSLSKRLADLSTQIVDKLIEKYRKCHMLLRYDDGTYLMTELYNNWAEVDPPSMCKNANKI